MFPNFRLLIAATFVSVTALSFGFGVFAALRVSHEPLSNLPPVTAPLQLVSQNVAPMSDRIATGEPFDPRFQLSVSQVKAAVPVLPEPKPQVLILPSAKSPEPSVLEEKSEQPATAEPPAIVPVPASMPATASVPTSAPESRPVANVAPPPQLASEPKPASTATVDASASPVQAGVSSAQQVAAPAIEHDAKKEPGLADTTGILPPSAPSKSGALDQAATDQAQPVGPSVPETNAEKQAAETTEIELGHLPKTPIKIHRVRRARAQPAQRYANQNPGLAQPNFQTATPLAPQPASRQAMVRHRRPVRRIAARKPIVERAPQQTTPQQTAIGNPPVTPAPQ